MIEVGRVRIIHVAKQTLLMCLVSLVFSYLFMLCYNIYIHETKMLYLLL